jgi:O-antigen ligase
MSHVFRSSSERLAMALLRTPSRRRAVAGVALIAYYTAQRPPVPATPRREPDSGVAVLSPPFPLQERIARALPPPAELVPAPTEERPVGAPPLRRWTTARDRKIIAWLVAVVFALIAVVGQVGSAQPVTIVGIAGTVIVIGALMPELILALFLLAGAIKAAPWMPALPIDLTLLSWLGMVVAMVGLTLRPGGLPRVPRTAMLGLGLTALVVASVWWSRDPAAGWTKAVTFELLTMGGFVAPLLLIRTRAAMTRLMLALTGSGLLIALTTVATDNPSQPLISANGNEITAGLYPAIGLVAAIGYFALLPRGRWRLIGFLPAIVLLPAVVAAGSRGVLVAGAAALAFVIIRHIRCAKRPLLAAVIVGVSLLIGAQLATTLAGGAAAKYESQLLSTNSSQVLGDRGFLYHRAEQLAFDHSIAGVGAGGFATSSIVYERLLYPHNIVLELASEQGFGAVLLLAMLVSAAWWARRRVPGGLKSPEAVVTGGLIILALSEGFFSFDINRNRMLWFALGLAFALPQLRSAGTPKPEPNR